MSWRKDCVYSFRKILEEGTVTAFENEGNQEWSEGILFSEGGKKLLAPRNRTA